MNNQEINIAITEALGQKPWIENYVAQNGDSICMQAETAREVDEWRAQLPDGSWAKEYETKPFYRYPNYAGDLNCCAEFEKGLDFAGYQGRQDYEKWVRAIVAKANHLDADDADCQGDFGLITATAIQRCEAFLRTKGKWIDQPEGTTSHE